MITTAKTLRQFTMVIIARSDTTISVVLLETHDRVQRLRPLATPFPFQPFSETVRGTIKWTEVH